MLLYKTETLGAFEGIDRRMDDGVQYSFLVIWTFNRR